MKFYTWKDIERYTLMHYNDWKDQLYNIEVYPDEIMVYPKQRVDSSFQQVLNTLFPRNIDMNNLIFRLDDADTDISIFIDFDYEEIGRETSVMPLFKKAIYQDSAYPTTALGELQCPVIAFHSYKGGVGRTLSLIAFAQAWSNIQKDPQNNKLLIIDSDLEAPGLTLI